MLRNISLKVQIKFQVCHIMTVVDKAQTPKQKQWASIMRMRALMDYETKEKYVRTLIPQIKSKCIKV